MLFEWFELYIFGSLFLKCLENTQNSVSYNYIEQQLAFGYYDKLSYLTFEFTFPLLFGVFGLGLITVLSLAHYD